MQELCILIYNHRFRISLMGFWTKKCQKHFGTKKPNTPIIEFNGVDAANLLIILSCSAMTRTLKN